MKKLLFASFIAVLCLKGFALSIDENPTDTTNYLLSNSWDNYLIWNLSQQSSSTATKENYIGVNDDGINITFSFPSTGGWFDMTTSFDETYDENNPIVFFIKSTSSDVLELKFTDTDGSVFGVKGMLSDYNNEWKHLTVYMKNTSYWWGGDSKFDQFSSFSVAASGSGSGTIWIDEIGVGIAGLETSFPSVFDPDSTLAGIGFAQRRDASMTEEDPLVLEYLKVLQDNSSPEQQIMPSMEGDQAQTFNNCMAAIAFLVKDEKERAERILDFYSDATDINNTDIRLQNFYFNGETRGFYQHVSLASYRDEGGNADRWMGDMAWLLIACKNYEFKYDSDRYADLTILLKDLLLSYYTDAANGGYIQHGWRNGDSYLHENSGHHEGNIDCYVALELCGEYSYAQKIRTWLEHELNGRTELPLDLYTWRVLAFGSDYSYLLNIPEYNFRYRKILEVNGENVMGFWHSADIYVNNFWNDGTGHIACAYLNYGDKERGYFYANQMDKLIVDRDIGGVTTHAIPYTLNRSANQEWVDITKGFLSATAWYILAKNSYNPFLSDRYTGTEDFSVKGNGNASNLQTSPNPFINDVRIDYSILTDTYFIINIFNLQGEKIRTLMSSYSLSGNYSQYWNATNSKGDTVPEGMYFIQILTDDYSETQKVLYLNSF